MSRNPPDRNGRIVQMSRSRLRQLGVLMVILAGLPTTTCYLEVPYDFQQCDDDEDCDLFPTTVCYDETFCSCPQPYYRFCPGYQRCVPDDVCLAKSNVLDCDAGHDAGDGGGGGVDGG
jgi:hypothetical protein